MVLATGTAPSRTLTSGQTSWRSAVGVLSFALFMTSLDHLVVLTALPAVRDDLDAAAHELHWVVNAYTLAFASLLLLGAALGDRFGRRRVFMSGVAAFSAASALAAQAESLWQLVAARAAQGAAAALVLPLTLTLLHAAAPPAKRGLAIGLWSGISGLGVALGPLVGGAVVQAAGWQWIFWLNVPIGAAAVLLSRRVLRESYGPTQPLDVAGAALATGGALGLVAGVVRAGTAGWTNGGVLISLLAGASSLAAFLWWEHRATAPMLPLRLLRDPALAPLNVTAFAMFFGLFGAAYLLTQYFQTGLGHEPVLAGLMTLPWTAAPLIVSPVAGALADRHGARSLILTGLVLQVVALVCFAAVIGTDTPYLLLVPPLMLAGVGMYLVLAPLATAVLAAVPEPEAGIASGTTNAIREIGAVFGIAVLVSVFSSHGGYDSPASFVAGARAALPWAALVLFAALLVAARIRPALPAAHGEADPSQTGC